MNDVAADLSICTLCRDRFAATATAHAPRPIVWFQAGARVLIAGQAPGMKVHLSGKPFTDPSGDRLRDWMALTPEVFYDRSQVAIVPMAFCFPGYSAKGSDLPPPPICAQTWRARVLEQLPDLRLILVVGSYAMKYHLGRAMPVTDAVKNWKVHGDDLFVLPHPSWRNNGWLRKNPWFETEVLPRLQRRIKEVLDDG
ncbi:MAG: uracil-DNA glycosylase family protein [Roseobacter sp.]